MALFKPTQTSCLSYKTHKEQKRSYLTKVASITPKSTSYIGVLLEKDGHG